MLPPARGRRRKDRLSVSILPQQSLRTDIPSPCINLIFNDPDFFQRICDDNQNNPGITIDMTEAQNATMAEVIDFLEQQERNVFWLPPRTIRRDLQPIKRIVSPLDPAYIQAIEDLPEAESFNLVVEFISLQLLASCYTILPATSADSFPISQQRMGSRAITALRLHTHYRLSPAAGHHARENSETSAWPGLYNGLSREEKMAESISLQRRRAMETPGEDNSQSEQDFEEHVGRMNQGNDGSKDSRKSSLQHTPTASPPWMKLVSKLTCEPNKGKVRSPSVYDPSKTKPTAPAFGTNRPSPPKSLSSNSIFKIPPGLRLRRVQSDKGTPFERSEDLSQGTGSRRNSSGHLIGCSRTFPFVIPEIRRISASTASQMSQRTPLGPDPNFLMETPPVLTNPMERRLSFSRYSPRISIDAISPSDMSGAALTGRRHSSYFVTPLATTHEVEDSKTSRLSESDDEDCASDDSACRRRRNRSVVGSDIVEFSNELKRRSQKESDGGRESDFLAAVPPSWFTDS